MCVCVFVCVFVCVQISSLKPLGQLKPNIMWNLHGIGEESLFKWSRRGSSSFVVLHYCQPPWGGGGGAFSRDFTKNLSPQCRAFSRALKTEKLKAPLFPSPVRAGTTNDWCIKGKASVPTDDLIPKARRCRNQHSMSFQTPIANTDVYKGSFPQTIRVWNALPDSLISSAEDAKDCVAKFTSLVRARSQVLVSNCRFGVSPVNYPDPDPG